MDYCDSIDYGNSLRLFLRRIGDPVRQSDEKGEPMKKTTVLLSVFLLALSLLSCAKEPAGGLPAADAVLPAEKALEAAKKEDVVVVEDARCTSGKELWDAFYAKTEKKEPASVVCASFRTLDKESVSEELYKAQKDRYPQLTFTLIEFDGETFRARTRLSTVEKTDDRGSYRYLLHLSGDMPPSARYAHYDHYVLSDDPSLTWEQILAVYVSSSAHPVIPRHFPVFSSYTD